ncbi:MAG TPA: hypothetical protein VIH90_02840 [Candidatus Saccharimonadales bacterium]
MTKTKKSKKSSNSKRKTLRNRFNFKNLLAVLVIAIIAILGIKFLFVSHAATPTITGTPVAIVASSANTGYWIAASDGGVFAEGTAPFYGSMGGKALSAPITGIASTADGNGYWLVGADGAVYAFGDAGYHNGVNNIGLNGTSVKVPGATIVSIADDPANGGYILIDNFGHSYAFGNAPPYNVSPWTTPTGENVNSLDMNSSGSGLYVLTTDGRVLSYGSVAGQGGYLGSTAGGQKWIGIASDPGTNGYYMVSNIGGVYAESGAAFYGSAVSNNPVGGIIGMAVTSDGKGYWLLGGDGGIFSYGDAVYQGRVTPTAPVISAFTSSLPNVVSGQPVSLSYAVTNATQVSITGYGGALSPTSGKVNVTPTNTTSALTKITYTLSAINTGNTPAVSQVVVGVCPAGTVVNATYGCVTPSSLTPKCPAGQTGTPPNCTTAAAPTCPAGQTGTPPNCYAPGAFAGLSGHDCYQNFDWIPVGTGGECVLNASVAGYNSTTAAEIAVINGVAGANFVHVDTGGHVVYNCVTILGCENVTPY